MNTSQRIVNGLTNIYSTLENFEWGKGIKTVKRKLARRSVSPTSKIKMLLAKELFCVRKEKKLKVSCSLPRKNCERWSPK